jgi:hypothetical protein
MTSVASTPVESCSWVASGDQAVTIAECEAWIAGCRAARRETVLKLIGRKG